MGAMGMSEQSETRHTGLCLSLCSDFVEAIQHFATHPQGYNTQREDQEGGHFLISSKQPEQATRRLLGR
jgi:hypothetical protein